MQQTKEIWYGHKVFYPAVVHFLLVWVVDRNKTTLMVSNFFDVISGNNQKPENLHMS